jgi:hypothetical protein
MQIHIIYYICTILYLKAYNETRVFSKHKTIKTKSETCGFHHPFEIILL